MQSGTFSLEDGYPKSIEHLSDEDRWSELPESFEKGIDSSAFDIKGLESELCLTKGDEILCYATYQSAGEPVKIKDKYS